MMKMKPYTKNPQKTPSTGASWGLVATAKEEANAVANVKNTGLWAYSQSKLPIVVIVRGAEIVPSSGNFVEM